MRSYMYFAFNNIPVISVIYLITLFLYKFLPYTSCVLSILIGSELELTYGTNLRLIYQIKHNLLNKNGVISFKRFTSGKFCIFCRLLIFFSKSFSFLFKFFRECHQKVKQFGFRSDPTFRRA